MCTLPPTQPTHLKPAALSPYSSSRLLTWRLSPALLPFVLPAVVMSISPRKCISLRELQTTKRMPTVCSPSTSHFSWKNRFILSFFPLIFLSPRVPLSRNPPSCQRGGFHVLVPPGPRSPCKLQARTPAAASRLLAPSSQSPSMCRCLAILILPRLPSCFLH